jgi:hypothetical protein
MEAGVDAGAGSEPWPLPPEEPIVPLREAAARGYPYPALTAEPAEAIHPSRTTSAAPPVPQQP